MRTLFSFLFFVLGFAVMRADDAPPDAGILITKAVAGYNATAVTFVSIQWVDTNGGFAADRAGNKTAFTNDSIGRIIYFDSVYYKQIDHNPAWLNWRAGLQSREVVVLPTNAVSIGQGDLLHLRTDARVLEDAVARYPAGQAVVNPLIATIKTDIDKLSNGQALQNGKWIAAKDASDQSAPVVGDANLPVTFTTKDGKKYFNARVMVTDSGVSVLTSDGGGLVQFDQLPDDMAGFPPSVREKIIETRATQQKPAPAPAEATTSKSVLDTVTTSAQGAWNQVRNYFSPATTNSASATSAAPATNSAPSPASAPPPAPAPASPPPPKPAVPPSNPKPAASAVDPLAGPKLSEPPPMSEPAMPAAPSQIGPTNSATPNFAPTKP